MKPDIDQDQLDYIKNRNEEIAARSMSMPVEDLAETYELSEAEIRKIIQLQLRKLRQSFLNLEKESIRNPDRLLDRIKVMRLRGFSKEYISRILKIRLEDISDIINTFKIPYGIKCEDCNRQIILKKVLSRHKLCRRCAKDRLSDYRIRYTRERYRTDPEFREKMKCSIRNRRHCRAKKSK